jgi:hypothetical protein
MAPDFESGGDWVLLSMAVVRMGELNPAYRRFLDSARSELMRMIQAGRAHLRGHANQAPNGPWISIIDPITPRHTLNLFHNSLSIRTGPHSYETLFRDVQIEWNSVVSYLCPPLVESLRNPRGAVEPPANAPVSSQAAGGADQGPAVQAGGAAKVASGSEIKRPRRKRDRAKEAISAVWPAGVPEVSKLSNTLLYKTVADWIKADETKHGHPHQEISEDTVLRAAGRQH